MVEACNGSIVNDGVKNYISQQEHKQEYSTLTTEQRAKLKLTIKNYAEATLFLMTAGGNASLVRKELNNDYVRGNDNYPMDITSARAYIVNYKSALPQQQQQPQLHYQPDDLTQKGMLLAQNGGKTPIDMSIFTCRHPECGQTGLFQNFFCVSYPIEDNGQGCCSPKITF